MRPRAWRFSARIRTSQRLAASPAPPHPHIHLFGHRSPARRNRRCRYQIRDNPRHQREIRILIYYRRFVGGLTPQRSTSGGELPLRRQLIHKSVRHCALQLHRRGNRISQFSGCIEYVPDFLFCAVCTRMNWATENCDRAIGLLRARGVAWEPWTIRAALLRPLSTKRT